MGYALAKAAYLRGAEVTLISGPSNENIYQEINCIKVRSALEMKKAVDKEIKNNEVLIMSAAVADYKPSSISNKKIKKEDKLSSIKLIETEDILSSVDKKNKLIVGFALETDNEFKNASKKLKNKNLDMIILNSLKDKNSGFEVDTNKISIIHKSGKQNKFSLQTKFQSANKILSEILKIK
jgi:phosphopantothenoylcysteine decarboxylase/phosphopantothenate--cysteine ligase